MTLTPTPESLGTAPGRGRLTGRRIVVVGAGTRRSEDPNPPIGNGRAIAVLCAREGADVACVDIDSDAAQYTAHLCEQEGAQAAAIEAPPIPGPLVARRGVLLRTFRRVTSGPWWSSELVKS